VIDAVIVNVVLDPDVDPVPLTVAEMDPVNVVFADSTDVPMPMFGVPVETDAPALLPMMIWSVPVPLLAAIPITIAFAPFAMTLFPNPKALVPVDSAPVPIAADCVPDASDPPPTASPKFKAGVEIAACITQLAIPVPPAVLIQMKSAQPPLCGNCIRSLSALVTMITPELALLVLHILNQYPFARVVTTGSAT
jgi:hypothetical protein